MDDTDNVSERSVQCNSGKIYHLLNFKSTMFSKKTVSTYHTDWIAVDYIFYTKVAYDDAKKNPSMRSIIKLLANYELPTKNHCFNIGPIPNSIYGSDHFSIASDFVLVRR